MKDIAVKTVAKWNRAVSQVKSLAKKSRALTFLARQGRRPFLWGVRLGFCLGAFLRGRGAASRYQPLLAYKNKYAGRRCFIVATGPSLTLADLERLDGEITFGVNSLVLALGQTRWRPTFYGIQDPLAYDRLRDAILAAGLNTVFVASAIANSRHRRWQLPKAWIPFPLDLLGHGTLKKPYSTKFSANCYARVYDGYSVVYSMLQLAVYMGFTELYLLGADCDFSSPERYFKDAAYTTAAGPAVYDGMEERLLAGYAEAKAHTQAKGIRLVNASRGGCLTLLPRAGLEEVLCEKRWK